MGTPKLVTSVVARAMTLYDHNRNGRIDLVKPAGLDAIRTDNEAYRVEWRALLGIKDEIVVGAFTMRDLFYAADRNRDNLVTRNELESAIARYDTNHDGLLSVRSFGNWLLARPLAEWGRFKRMLGEERVRVEEFDTRRDLRRRRRAARVDAQRVTLSPAPRERLITVPDNSGSIRDFLRTPARAVLKGVGSENGTAGSDSLLEGLRLLQELSASEAVRRTGWRDSKTP